MKIIKSDIKIPTAIYMYVHVLKTNDAISDINQIINVGKIVMVSVCKFGISPHDQVGGAPQTSYFSLLR